MQTMRKTMQAVLAGTDAPLIAFVNKKQAMTEAVLALHTCTNAKCGTRVVANRLAAPTCLVCSEPTKVDTKKTMDFTLAEVQELPGVGTCAGCGTDFHASEALAGVIGESEKPVKGYCMLCAGDITLAADLGDDDADADADADETADEDESDDSDDADADLDADESDTDDSDADDSTDDEDADSTGDDSEDTDDDADLGDEDADIGDDDDADADESDADETDDSDADVDPSLDLGTDDADLGDDTEGLDDSDADADTDGSDDGDTTDPDADADDDASKVTAKLKVSSLQKVLASNDPEIDMVRIGVGASTKWYLFGNDQPLAVSYKKDVTASLQPLFETDRFSEAFHVQAEAKLDNSVLADFGFKPVTVDIAVSDAVAQSVEAGIEKATGKLKLAETQVQAKFKQCVGIAAGGIHKGMFGENKLRTALIAALTAIRVSKAEQVVDKVLAEHGIEAQQQIVAKAIELMGKPTSALNEVAAMVQESGYRHEKKTASTSVVPFLAALANDGDEDDSQNQNRSPVTAGVASNGAHEAVTALIRGIARR